MEIPQGTTEFLIEWSKMQVSSVFKMYNWATILKGTFSKKWVSAACDVLYLDPIYL
jgi:hypothetical protein